MADQSQAMDLGQAAMARPSTIVVLEAKSRGSIQQGERIELTRYSDATLADRLHHRAQISDKQHAAAVRLMRLWTAAGLNPRCSARYGGAPGRALDSGDDNPSPLDVHRRTMREVPGAYRGALETMLCEQHLGWNGIGALQAGLDFLADLWGETGEEWFGDEGNADE